VDQSKEMMLPMYRDMVKIRQFEERAADLFVQGKLPGFIHVYVGQEAVAVGTCTNLRGDDAITSTHRGHGHVIAKGGDVRLMFSELYGKSTGYCKGKGGSQHIADIDSGILGANGIVGGGLPIAVGAAFAAKQGQRGQVVVCFFEDIGVHGGNFGVTRQLVEEFGEERVRDTPISEIAIVGSAVGAAMTGLRPVVEIMFAGFIGCCFDALYMKLGMWRQVHGNIPLPVVVRAPMGGAGGAGLEHAYCPESLLIHSPGLKVLVPATPYDAKGLLKTAIRGEDPCVYLEHIALYTKRGPEGDADTLVPFGKAEVRREGKGATIVTYSAMVYKAMEAAEKLAQEGIECEVIDLRTLVPLDEEAIYESVKKTGRLVVVHEAMERGGVAGEIMAKVMENAFDYLDAPVKRVGALNVPNLGGAMESVCLPQTENIVEAVRSLVRG